MKTPKQLISTYWKRTFKKIKISLSKLNTKKIEIYDKENANKERKVSTKYLF